jgi:hypothetical protein
MLLTEIIEVMYVNKYFKHMREMGLIVVRYYVKIDS